MAIYLSLGKYQLLLLPHPPALDDKFEFYMRNETIFVVDIIFM